MDQPVAGSGNAKLILSGEHWVLDGAQALAIGLPGLTATATMRRGPEAGLDLDPQLAATAADDTAKMVALALHQAGTAGAVHTAIRATVPLRRGLGSSAAVAVALVRAAASLNGQALTLAALRERARALETLVHGRSSGLDPAAAACADGGVLFGDGRVLRAVGPVHRGLAGARWLLVDVGQGRPTREAVAHALARREAMTAQARAECIASASHAAAEAAQALEQGQLARLTAALCAAQAVLEPLDVTTAAMRTCLDALLQHGALAVKQTGAGLGGVVLGLFSGPDSAQGAAQKVCATGQDCWMIPVCPEVATDWPETSAGQTTTDTNRTTTARG